MSKPGIGLKEIQILYLYPNTGDVDEDILSKIINQNSVQKSIQFSDQILTCTFRPQDRVSVIGELKKLKGLVTNTKPLRLILHQYGIDLVLYYFIYSSKLNNNYINKPGEGLIDSRLVFLDKVKGDKDEADLQHFNTQIANQFPRVHFVEETLTCYFHIKDKVTTIQESKKKQQKHALL